MASATETPPRSERMTDIPGRPPTKQEQYIPPPSSDPLDNPTTLISEHAADENAEHRRVLSDMDNKLVVALQKGVIRLMNRNWLLSTPGGFLMVRRQELEQRDESPFLSDDEAAELILRGTRCVGALTYVRERDSNP